LERGEKVLYLYHEHDPGLILDYLRQAGLPPEGFLARGQLELAEAQPLLFPREICDPQVATRTLRQALNRAMDEGWGGLRLTAEMAAGLNQGAAGGELLGYECLSNALFPDHLLIALCQYDRRRFDSAQLLEALALHSEVVTPTGRHDNFYFSAPPYLTRSEPAESLLQHRLERLERRTAQARTLDEDLEFATAVLDAMAAPVLVLDASGRLVFANISGEQLLGEPAEKLRGRLVWEVLEVQEGPGALRDLVRGGTEEGSTPPAPPELLTQNGRRRCYLTRPHLPGGRASGHLVLTVV
jgi:PAS domain-containing protein